MVHVFTNSKARQSKETPVNGDACERTSAVTASVAAPNAEQSIAHALNSSEHTCSRTRAVTASVAAPKAEQSIAYALNSCLKKEMMMLTKLKRKAPKHTWWPHTSTMGLLW
jgi:thioesterase domain-containing protein